MLGERDHKGGIWPWWLPLPWAHWSSCRCCSWTRSSVLTVCIFHFLLFLRNRECRQSIEMLKFPFYEECPLLIKKNILSGWFWTTIIYTWNRGNHHKWQHIQTYIIGAGHWVLDRTEHAKQNRKQCENFFFLIFQTQRKSRKSWPNQKLLRQYFFFFVVHAPTENI